MSASRPILPPADDIDSHDALTVREIATERRRRVARWLAALVALALLAGVIFGARPALHCVKAWQARRLARDAVRLTEQGNLEAARTRVQDALAIWRMEPEASHAAAFFLTRAGAYRQALPYWQQLETVRPLTPADLRDYATTEVNLGDPDAAAALLGRVWPAGEAGTRPDWLLGMQIALRRGHHAEAVTLAKKLLDDGQTLPRERLNAASVVLSIGGTPGDETLAWRTVAAIARGDRTPESLAALILLAEQRANPAAKQPGAELVPPLTDLIAAIEAHPLAKTQHHLLVDDLRLTLEPAKRAELIQAAMDRFGGAKEDADLAALTAWLYGKGEYEKVLAVLPLTRATGDRALYLQYLDTLAALGRWAEIRGLVQAQKFPLDAMTSQMFLARCAAQLGEPEVRDARWQAALDAAGKDPGKLLAVGQYAAKNGAVNTAAAAFRAAVHADPDARPAYDQLVLVLETMGNTKEMLETVKAMDTHWPRDAAIRNDLAYLDALENENVPAARDTARELLRADPASIAPHITLALAELRLHNALAALDALRSLNLAKTGGLQPRQGAIYAAVLWETSYGKEAHAMVKNLPLDRLLPEERELISPIENDGTTP